MKRFLVYAPCEDYANDPAFRIRLLALQKRMARRGFTWEIRARPKMPWGRLALAWSARGYDGVILHKKMLDPLEARVLRMRSARPRKIFMDIDDATMYHEKKLGWWARRRLDRRFAATARIVDVVCAGNSYLGEIFRQQGVGAVPLMPTVMDPAHYQVKRHQDAREIRLVWIGSRSTRKFLEDAMPALAKAATRVKALGKELRVVAICDREPASADGVPVELVPWTLEGEGAALVRGDIGIAPTPETRFTLSKCGFKIVQYMATGLPVVASPVGANVELVKETADSPAAGFLPATSDEWPAAIEQLAGDVELRRRMGAAGRDRVERTYSLDQAANQWAELLGG